jgi:DNA sulfur modification protein DndB
MFAVDGQHRVEGIKEAVRERPGLGAEEQAVIFVAHKTSPEGRQRTRRLFSTLNKYAKPVSQSELVALSEDDAFAIVTRRLIDEHPGLGPEFVPLLPSVNIPLGEKKCLTSVVGLYELTKLVAPPEIRKDKKKHETGPPSSDVVAAIWRESESFWKALQRHVSPIREVCTSDPSLELAGQYRHADGGYLLFRPVGLRAFAKAARVLMDRGESADKAVTRLAKLNLQLDHSLWRDVIWRPETKTVLHKYVRLAQNILLHEAGVKPDSKNYSVLDEYKRITGRAYPKA